MEWFDKTRARRHVRASMHRAALEDLPEGLETAWRQGAAQEYPGIRTDAFFFACAADGLMRFFDAARRGGLPCALPSDAADSVWHAWLRRDPIGLERFCRRHFGQAVPHVDRAALDSGALANTLMAGRRLEGIAPLGPDLPRLFGLDARLRMPGGHGYWGLGGGIVHARLDRRGRGLGRALPHPALTASALLAAGLVDADTVLAHAQRQRELAGAADPFVVGALGFTLAGDSDAGFADSGGGGD